ncbi:MAG: hypothetical protein R3175_08055 [Marinobacter sp.]|nr:hypothetical protein [Marinobacter sp.]MDX1755993.1 hypothetical protein [Marinobacter sp.]
MTIRTRFAVPAGFALALTLAVGQLQAHPGRAFNERPDVLAGG